jgi:hypothetical protein
VIVSASFAVKSDIFDIRRYKRDGSITASKRQNLQLEDLWQTAPASVTAFNWSIGDIARTNVQASGNSFAIIL